MSREFGDEYGGGFFHNKVAHAAADARGGQSVFTRLLADVLQPLAEIAYEASAVEAGDSSEEVVIRTIIEQLPLLRQAVQGLEYSIQSHRNLADDAAYRAVRQFLPEPRWEDRKKKIVAIDVPNAHEERLPHVIEEQERLLLRHVHEFAQNSLLCRSGMYSNGGGRFWTWYYSPWSEAGLLREENARLRRALEQLLGRDMSPASRDLIDIALRGGA